MVIVFYILYFNFNVNCFSIKGVPDTFLKELQYKNIIFKCSKELQDDTAFNFIDNFLINNSNKFKYNITKYYKIVNGVATPFNLNTCYAHPNLFFGIYNNLYFNFQFSHQQYNNYFKLISDKDLFDRRVDQYLSTQLYIYNGDLNQQFLNQNSLLRNNFISYKNDFDALKVQNYLNFNKNRFNNIVKKALKI